MAPAMANAEPTQAASRMRGARTWRMMSCSDWGQEGVSGQMGSRRMHSTCRGPIDTAPTDRHPMNIPTTPTLSRLNHRYRRQRNDLLGERMEVSVTSLLPRSRQSPKPGTTP